MFLFASLALLLQTAPTVAPCGPDANPLLADTVQLVVDCAPGVDGPTFHASIQRVRQKRTVVQAREITICVTGTVSRVDSPKGWVASRHPCVTGGEAITWRPAKKAQIRVVNRRDGFRVHLTGPESWVTCYRLLSLENGGAGQGCMA